MTRLNTATCSSAHLKPQSCARSVFSDFPSRCNDHRVSWDRGRRHCTDPLGGCKSATCQSRTCSFSSSALRVTECDWRFCYAGVFSLLTAHECTRRRCTHASMKMEAAGMWHSFTRPQNTRVGACSTTYRETAFRSSSRSVGSDSMPTRSSSVEKIGGRRPPPPIS